MTHNSLYVSKITIYIWWIYFKTNCRLRIHNYALKKLTPPKKTTTTTTHHPQPLPPPRSLIPTSRITAFLSAACLSPHTPPARHPARRQILTVHAGCPPPRMAIVPARTPAADAAPLSRQGGVHKRQQGCVLLSRTSNLKIAHTLIHTLFIR
jgi:hypothetical protein